MSSRKKQGQHLCPHPLRIVTNPSCCPLSLISSSSNASGVGLVARPQAAASAPVTISPLYCILEEQMSSHLYIHPPTQCDGAGPSGVT